MLYNIISNILTLPTLILRQKKIEKATAIAGLDSRRLGTGKSQNVLFFFFFFFAYPSIKQNINILSAEREKQQKKEEKKKEKNKQKTKKDIFTIPSTNRLESRL